jgi:hypothetical protein
MQASQITAGQRFTDDTGHSFTATRVEAGQANGAGIYVYVEGQAYPEFYLNETPVTIYRARLVQPADPKPFKVYTRDYNAAGDKDVRIFSFATRKAQGAFVLRTNRCVTFTN